MQKNLTELSPSNSRAFEYRQACKRFFQKNRMRSCNIVAKINREQKQQGDRLTSIDIQRITKQLMKDGVVNNVKGKMYCLKLGQISNFKHVSHYFYTSQYRKKYLKRHNQFQNITIQNLMNIQKQELKPKRNKCSTQPSENIFRNRENQSQRKNPISRTISQASHLYNWNQIQQLNMDEKLKQKFNKYICPSGIGRQDNSFNNKSAKMGNKIRRERRGYSVTKIL